MRPLLIGHRGAPRERPENTIPSFLRALELGADGIELDVHGTVDGVVVVHHDPVPRALPEESWMADRAIAELSAEELRTFSVDVGVRIPTLAEVLLAVDGRADVFVEIKGRGIEQAVVDVIRASPLPSRCAVHSFDHRAARLSRELAPEIPAGILLASYLIDPVAALRAAGATDLWQSTEWIDAALVDAVHGAGGRVMAWTVNDRARAAELAALGVDGLCTDVLPVAAAAGAGAA